MSACVRSFSSGKGGVGKTTLVANLGSLWAAAGQRTLLIDGDWNLGKLGITLGVKPRWTVESFIKGEVTLRGAIHSITPHLSLLAAPSGILGFEELSEEARRQIYFEMEGLQQDFDQILLDHSSGLGSSVLEFAAASHQQVIVTTTEPTSLTDAYAIMKLLSKRFAVGEFNLVVTSSHCVGEAEKIISRFLDVVRGHLGVRVSLLEILPWDPKVAESIRSQTPFVQKHPQSRLTSLFATVCTKLDQSPSRLSSGLRFFSGDHYANSVEKI